MDNLRISSTKIAIAIYNNWRKDGRMYISKDEAVKIAAQFDIQLSPEEITGQSLLTCDGIGNWKFAHKSILEFFLANEAHENPKFLSLLDFKGMDMARKFYSESNPQLLYIDELTKLKGSLPSKCKNLRNFYIYDYFVLQEGTVSQSQYNTNMQRSSFKDAIGICNEVNRRYGYSEVYDDEYCFLDVNGTKVTDIAQVRGFRLPTVCELQTYNIVRSFSAPKSVGSFTKLISVTATSPLKITIESRESNIKRQLQATKYREWCYDISGISAVGIRTVFDDASPVDFRSNMADEVQKLAVHQVAELSYAFRLVFIP